MLEIEENKDDRRDILRKLMEISAEKGEKVNFSADHIYAESHSLLYVLDHSQLVYHALLTYLSYVSSFAGADTTAIAMSSIIGHMIRSPRVYQKLTSEIDTAIADGELSVPVKYKEAIKLPYLRACINEGMRMHPSVGLSMPRESPPGGITINDTYIPEGYNVGINPAVVHYDTDWFGADAEHYNPDRWLGEDAQHMEKAMLHFGIGTRICIGKNVS